MLVATGVVSLLADTTGQQQSGLTTICADGCPGKTILLVGSDARVDAAGNPLTPEELALVSTELTEGGVNTDTIMLIRIPPGGGRATAVSIPRDTWIADPPPGPSQSSDSVPYAPNKVNSFYGSAKYYTAARLADEGVTDKAEIERQSSNAGRRMLITVLEKLTGAHIDDYAEVNLFGFYLLSNAIGGVPVCLNAAVDDSFSGAVFPAGPQEVSGSAALAFVRQRHGLPGGDLDRVRRQQAFLAGAISKVLSVGTLTDPGKLNDLVDAANRSIVLSDGFNLLELAGQMSALSSGDVTFLTLPTHGDEPTTDTDALHVDVPEVQALFKHIDGTSTSSSPSTTAAGTTAPGAAGFAAVTGTPALRGGAVASAGTAAGPDVRSAAAAGSHTGAGAGSAAAVGATDPTTTPADETLNAATPGCVN